MIAILVWLQYYNIIIMYTFKLLNINNTYILNDLRSYNDYIAHYTI